MTKLSDSIIEQIVPLYEELHTYAAVGRQLGISPSTVKKYVTNMEVNKPKKERIKITEEMEKEINEYFAFSLNLAETGRHFNISGSTVKNHLNEENKKAFSQQVEDKEALYYYIYHLFGDQPVSNWNLTQVEKFKRQGINYKAQLLTLKYWYEIRHNTTEKSNGSIGIIPYIINDSKSYYLKQVEKRKQMEEGIKKQLQNDRMTVQYKPGDYFTPPNKKKKKTIDLNSLEGNK